MLDYRGNTNALNAKCMFSASRFHDVIKSNSLHCILKMIAKNVLFIKYTQRVHSLWSQFTWSYRVDFYYLFFIDSNREACSTCFPVQSLTRNIAVAA